MAKLLNIGTRGSPLALAQSRETLQRLADAHGWPSEEKIREKADIVTIVTSGDKIQDKALRAFGGKGLFTKEIEDALLDGRIDLAVHSMKDVPTKLPDGLRLCAFLPREDPRDAFISHKAKSLEELPAGSVVGAASIRRQAQVLKARPDLKVETIRGTVETRLRKLADGEVDATFLALAGLRRLGLADKPTAICEVDDMLPAVAQAAIGLEVRSDDAETLGMLAPLNHRETEIRLSAERAFLAALDGSCRTPIAALAELDGDALRFRGQVLAPDGKESHDVDRSIRLERDPVAEAYELGAKAGDDIAKAAGPAFLDAIKL
ncbi:MAG: hydroxymethylbilane synthase [Pseudomonadota bacterium]